MLALIKACNKQITTDSTIYKGVCLGFGIDILLVSYNPPRIKGTQQNQFNKLIATLPLSVRSRQLIKSAKSNKSILNNKFYHNMVIYILEQLTNKSRFGKNPVDFAAINCNSTTSFQDVHVIIKEFLDGFARSEKQKTIFENVRSNIQQATPSWTRSLKQGGKRRRRKKTKRRRKRKGKKRKTRRRRKRR